MDDSNPDIINHEKFSLATIGKSPSVTDEFSESYYRPTLE